MPKVVRLRRQIAGWLLVPRSLLSVALGIDIAIWHAVGAIAWLIPMNTLLRGTLLLALGFELFGWAWQVQQLDA
jgi:hypothetical protein